MNDFAVFSKNLLHYRNMSGLTQRSVAEKLGVRQQTVAAWEANRSTPRPDVICRLALMFGVSTDQLLYSREELGAQRHGGAMQVAIVSRVRAGYDGFSEDELLGYEVVSGIADGEYVFVRVEGDSMQPQIAEGDLALVHRQEDVESGELAIVIIDDEVGVIKRVHKQAGGLLLQSFNSDYPVRFFPAEALHRVRIFGKVVRTERRW